MKTENTKETSVPDKTKAKVKTLKLVKETVETLSEKSSGDVRGGGGYSYGLYSAK